MKKVLFGLIIAVLGACHKESPVDVTWSDRSNVVLKKENVWLFGERVTVKYGIQKPSWSTGWQADVRLEYPERVNIPRNITIEDYDNDFTADSVSTYNPYLEIRKHNDPKARALHHASLVLAKLRRELNIDYVLACGPDPFVPTQPNK